MSETEVNPAAAATADGTRPAPAEQAGPPVVVSDRGACGLIELNRPKAANAINEEMRNLLLPHYDRWPRDPMNYAIVIKAAEGSRAFCAGGDVRELVAMAKADAAKARASLAREYAHNWKLQFLPRPHLALIDGAVMGSGVGLTLYGTHRVAGPNYRFAMPECAIGFVPDVGASWFLPRLPDQIGTYLALTARSIGRADAYALDLVSHCIPACEFDAIVADLANAEPVDPVLDERHQDPGPSELERHRATIAHCFGADTLEDILARLKNDVPAKDRDWADGVIADIAKMAPFSLVVTLEMLRRGAALELDEALKLETRVTARMLERPDLASGVAAMFVTRASPPTWAPQQLALVDRADVARMFAPLPDGELNLPLPPAPPSALA